MESGRKPASVALSFDGDCNASGNTVTRQNNKHYYRSMQLLPSKFTLFTLVKGNRCDHDKNQIKVSPFYRKSTLRNRCPHVIEESGKRIALIARHLRSRLSDRFIQREKNTPTGMLPWYLSLFENPRYLGLLYRHGDGRPCRKRRSESLEAAVCITLGTLISRCNLYKMAYGYHDQRNQFHFFDYTRLEKESGLTMSRIKRAMKVLKEVGLVKVTSVCKTLDDGRIINNYTKIELNEEIFFMLGLKNEYLIDRETSVLKFHEKQIRIEKKQNKLDLYRKTSFSRSKYAKFHMVKSTLPINTQNPLKSLADKMSINRPGRDRVQPNPIAVHSLNLYGTLIAKGYTPHQAIEFIKKSYPPPN